MDLWNESNAHFQQLKTFVPCGAMLVRACVNVSAFTHGVNVVVSRQRRRLIVCARRISPATLLSALGCCIWKQKRLPESWPGEHLCYHAEYTFAGAPIS